ncbi:hypothetical protein E2C01_065384 [Portunus trituberculatus]|uniref:Uncharacterized protein n=1 Tax=Portunus trituberculatus TaxID=210409 RepID=A0A5B7HN85_PORTR|nr:hypothetical protein [Portunus trituberculatus]
MVSVGEVHIGDGGPHVTAPVTHFALLEGGAAALGEADLGAEVKLPAGGGELEGAAPSLPITAAAAHTPTPRAQHQPSRPTCIAAAAVCGEELIRLAWWRGLVVLWCGVDVSIQSWNVLECAGMEVNYAKMYGGIS